MKREIITIDESGRLTIPTNDTGTIADVRMSETEIAGLFGVITPTVRAAIKAVYRSGVVKEYDAKEYIHYSNGSGLEVYYLKMVVTLAFRIDSYGAAKLREYILHTICTAGRKNIVNILFSYTLDREGNKGIRFFN